MFDFYIYVTLKSNLILLIVNLIRLKILWKYTNNTFFQTTTTKKGKSFLVNSADFWIDSNNFQNTEVYYNKIFNRHSHVFVNVIMPSKRNKILDYTRQQYYLTPHSLDCDSKPRRGNDCDTLVVPIHGNLNNVAYYTILDGSILSALWQFYGLDPIT